MADLSSNFIGIKSPNPFWLASAPPTDKEYNVVRAYEAGWGGVVWCGRRSAPRGRRMSMSPGRVTAEDIHASLTARP